MHCYEMCLSYYRKYYDNEYYDNLKSFSLNTNNLNAPFCGLNKYNPPTVMPYRVDTNGIYLEPDTRKPNLRIVGGFETTKWQYPWIVSLNKLVAGKYVHFCGGAIIHDYHILTAAHCADNFIGKESNLLIKIGFHNLNKYEGITMKVAKILIHEEWDRESNINDIAIYRTQQPIPYKLQPNLHNYQINSICLPKSDHIYPSAAIVAGWGQLGKDSHLSDKLMNIVVPQLSQELCQRQYDTLAEVNDNMICFGGYERHDTCYGDSGGPLMEKIDGRFQVIGIVSFGIPCAIKLYPTIYTKVSNYVDWIYDK
ncbi:trypsin-1-like, partial [Oppia nitens]|uniref:trypsin-1-like n=1 Tax=Oppia nitens TaxID=1686743 RepID=UPI0023DAC3A2